MDRVQAAAILGVDVDATAEEVSQSYRIQARLLHPDRWAGESASDREAAAEAMTRLNEARRTLRVGRDGDPSRTAPRHGHSDAPGPGGAGSGGAGSGGAGSDEAPGARPWPLVPNPVSAVWDFVRREAEDLLDNPYAVTGWVLLALASLATGVFGAFWIFVALAVWFYMRRLGAGAA